MDMNLYKQANDKIEVPSYLKKSTLEKMKEQEEVSHRDSLFTPQRSRRRLGLALGTLIPCTCLALLLICIFTMQDSIQINKLSKDYVQFNLGTTLGNSEIPSITEEQYIAKMKLTDLLDSIKEQCPTLKHDEYAASLNKDGTLSSDYLVQTYTNDTWQITISASSTKNYFSGYKEYQTSKLNNYKLYLFETGENQYTCIYRKEDLYLKLDFINFEEQDFIDMLNRLI